MSAALMLRALLRAGWLQLAAFSAMVIFFGTAGGSSLANGTAVLAMGCVGWIAGVSVAGLANSPNRTLVPDYSTTLFHVVLALTCVLPLACAAAWAATTATVPPLGPSVLAASAITLYFVRLGVNPVTINVALLAIMAAWFVLVAERLGYPTPVESLTDPGLQLSSLVIAALGLIITRRELRKPVLETAPGFPDTRLGAVRLNLTGDLRVSLVRECVASLPIVLVALLLSLATPSHLISVTFIAACFITAVVRLGPLLGNVHVVLCSYWFSGAVDTRQGLGRKSSGAILVRGLGWLPAAFVGAAILALGDTGGTTHFDAVILIAFAVLLIIALATGTVTRVPLEARWWPFAISGFAGGALPLLARAELGWPGRVVLLCVLLGAAVATRNGVGRALSRVDIAA